MFDYICSCAVECGCRVVTDNRAVKGGEMFFGIKGENCDGSDYAEAALKAGAKYAVINRGSKCAGISGTIEVEDTLETLKQLGIWNRKRFGVPVVGLTGTNGKTTTKNLISVVLAKKFKVSATEGNLNNDIGVPLSILKIVPDETEMAVIEMGANHPDDIAKLVKVSQPDYGLITNVGKAHLLGFGSFEGVKKAKGELYKWLGAHPGSLIFLNADDADLREMSNGLPCHFFEYGVNYQGAEILPSTPENPFLRIRLGEDVISTSLVGAYNATNVLAAIAVGEYFGVSRADAIAAVESFVPTNNRSQMTRTEKNTLIVDAYNANPSSMAAALDNFRTVEAARKVALLGDMRELGEDSVAEHVKVVRKLAEMGIEAFLVGDEFRKALDAEGAAFKWFESSEALAAFLSGDALKDAVILIKGSRGIQMEKVLPAL